MEFQGLRSASAGSALRRKSGSKNAPGRVGESANHDAEIAHVEPVEHTAGLPLATATTKMPQPRSQRFRSRGGRHMLLAGTGWGLGAA